MIRISRVVGRPILVTPPKFARKPMPIYALAVELLTPYLPGDGPFHVTLTFAQSLDGCIGALTPAGHAPIALSGADSLVVTHLMRNSHDAIMVGIGTVLADDPSLTVRHLPATGLDGKPLVIRHPRPVVVDSTLARFPLDCKLMKHPAGAPIVLTGKDHDPTRRAALETAGCSVSVISCSGPRVDLREGFRALAADHGIRSVMVEGGASIISCLLEECMSGPGAVDSLVVTIAPRILGALGVRPTFKRSEGAAGLRSVGAAGQPSAGTPFGLNLGSPKWMQFGNDIVLAARPA